MPRKPKNIYEELRLESIARQREELRRTISPMERELEEAEVQNKEFTNTALNTWSRRR